MEFGDFYNDRKFCPTCADYVPYLMSMEHSYCVECGSEVRLFSKDDWTEFNESMKTARLKGGRRRNDKKASA